MTGLEQIQDLSWAVYGLLFVLVLVRAVRRPTPAHIDMALFFGVIALLIILSILPNILSTATPEWTTKFPGALLMSLGYLLLRLVDDFADVPTLVIRISELGLVVSILAIFLSPTPMPALPSFALVACFVLLIGYDSWAFIRQAMRTRAVTRRRMQAAAAGSVCIGLVLLVAAAANRRAVADLVMGRARCADRSVLGLLLLRRVCAAHLVAPSESALARPRAGVARRVTARARQLARRTQGRRSAGDGCRPGRARDGVNVGPGVLRA